MLGIIKDRSLMYKKAKWIKAVANEQGLNEYDYDDFEIIRFKEVSEEVKTYFQPIANKLLGKKSWVIETNYIKDYEINDKLIIKNYDSTRANKDKWTISNVIKYTRRNEQLSLSNMKTNPHTSYVLELE